MLISSKIWCQIFSLLFICSILFYSKANDNKEKPFTQHSRLLRILKNITPFVPTMVDFAFCKLTPHGFPTYLLLETARLSGFDENIKMSLNKLKDFLDPKLNGNGKKIVGFLFGENGAINLVIENGGSWSAPFWTVIIKPITEYWVNSDEFKEKYKNYYDEAKKSLGKFCNFVEKYKEKVKFFKAELKDSKGKKIEENILIANAPDNE